MTSSGYEALLAAGWYLDGITKDVRTEWKKHYNIDPQEFKGAYELTDDEKRRVKGGTVRTKTKHDIIKNSCIPIFL